MKRGKYRTLLACGTVFALALTGWGASVALADDADVKKAVADALMDAKADQARTAYGLSTEAGLETLVEPKRTSADGEWVFGGGVFLVPKDSHASPVTSLFFARDGGDGWQVALKGTREFAEAARQAPGEILIDEGERKALAATAKPAARPYDQREPTGLALPWAQGQGDWRHWGVHGNSGTSRPYNSIDFYGGDGQVRASAGGYLYRYCGTDTPLIEVEHGNGWTTGYYHTVEQTDVTDGAQVAAYDYIGRIGEQLPCGGSANGDHVHWTLWSGGEPVGVDGKDIGGWTWREEPEAYKGWAERDGEQIYNSDCCLTNHGPSQQ
ncbi:M23 family metallopeptidase [Stackebrandtia nassauensis]|uniref:Peptidase M23 n=1 Tax=Stackebrandtia nassauensis (strain DSM 44728 / CIP 108903 / NRRL B-16338 / NBRC 102104 / LLR-40K-21) TaxID=446470 RepID=D3Q3K3_STANL|nr:peptidoglycan DD-metalloendopeptidase family protein [Stackebrandtia nassauensis]ADD42044.1 Peptidase M23 [Stackebrandtia nassauensis DSM 44728]